MTRPTHETFAPVAHMATDHLAAGDPRRATLQTGTPRARALAAWLAADYAAAPGRWAVPAIVPVSTPGQRRGTDRSDVTIEDTMAGGITLTLFGAGNAPLGAMSVDLFERVKRADVDLGDGTRMTLASHDAGPMPSGPGAMAFSVIAIERSPA